MLSELFTAPPRIRITPPRQITRPGAVVHMDCEATGDQPITVDWSKIGGQVPPNVKQSGTRLEFNGIQFTDGGRYLCTAVNAAGKTEGTAEVIVTQGPEVTD